MRLCSRLTMVKHRAIGLSPFAGKMLELKIKKQITDHFQKTNSIKLHHHDFMKGKSYLINLLTIIDIVTGRVHKTECVNREVYMDVYI